MKLIIKKILIGVILVGIAAYIPVLVGLAGDWESADYSGNIVSFEQPAKRIP